MRCRLDTCPPIIKVKPTVPVPRCLYEYLLF